MKKNVYLAIFFMVLISIPFTSHAIRLNNPNQFNQNDLKWSLLKEQGVAQLYYAVDTDGIEFLMVTNAGLRLADVTILLEGSGRIDASGIEVFENRQIVAKLAPGKSEEYRIEGMTYGISDLSIQLILNKQ